MIVLLHNRIKARLLAMPNTLGREIPPSMLSFVRYLFLKVSNLSQKQLIQVSGTSPVSKSNPALSNGTITSLVTTTNF